MTDASASQDAGSGAVVTRQTAMTKGFAFLGEIEKLPGKTRAVILEDLGLAAAREKKHPYVVGFLSGALMTALARFVLFALFGHH